jgi:hypothetical protein
MSVYQFVGHYGVQPGGHDGAGHDLHTLARLDLTCQGFTRKSGANDA